ncbi:cobalt transport family protein [Candidatus Phytoplasma oryzae]|uniref:Cobalt transport family protein n=1 Tax=Candidatus Phytoplasma oryzae TaxID=203274 RepID=A0A139JQI3_9MOLU|nr:energy-coupling factor transporter transmembrane component T [Candidatus Phytoplasma oryzae]KXT29136.1 cobalt transport family protein [Candidatus Phytoplasma oryzae]
MILIKKKSFLFSINPALKIILTILLFKIIFTLNFDFLFQEKKKISLLLSFLPFFFVTITLFLLLFSINFSFMELIKKFLHLKFFIFFSFLIYFSFDQPSEKYFKIYCFKHTFFWFFIIFLLFWFFFKKKINKNIYWLINMIILFMIPFILFINDIYVYNIQILFFKTKDLLKIIIVFFRILLILILNILISETTSFMEINDGLEIIFKPLKKIGIPVEIFTIMLSLIFMSIPFLLNEVHRIIKAQISRGLNFYTNNIFKKIYFLLALIIPIFILVFQKSFVLANAMETRGFILGNSRTKLSFYKMSINDYLILFIVLFFFVYSFFY